MWDKVAGLLGIEKKDAETTDLELATAALLVFVCASDEDYSEVEKQHLTDCMVEFFQLSKGDAERLIADAEGQEKDSTCLYRFTRVITAELDQEGRKDIVRLLWRVAFADNHIDNFEENALAKIAGLLGVSPRDRVLIKQEVAAAG